MNSGMRQLQEENFENCSGMLEFNVPVLEILVRPDQEYRGSFEIIVRGAKQTAGNVCVADYRMECPKQEFKGSRLEVPFIYHTRGMDAGDTANGEFCVISNLGEYFLPYEVRIENSVMNSELGEIKNLFHFANLAKVNWKEALECFYSESFETILTGSSRQYLEVYRALAQAGRESGRSFAMEQFLILIRKKQPVTFEFPTAKFSYSGENVPDEINVAVHRNGWGYTKLRVSLEGSFLQTDKEVLEEKDFENDSACLCLRVDRHRIYTGKNTAKLCLWNGSEMSGCEIFVDASVMMQEKELLKRQKKQLTDVAMRLYLDYRTGRKSKEECLELASGIIEHARGMDALMPALYQAHLKLLTGEQNSAVWLLKHVKRMLTGKETALPVYGYFLYLTAMSEGEDRVRAGELLDEYVKQYPNSFILYWGYMHKESLQNKSPGTVYRRYKELWELGCFSPLLYLEAAMLVLENPPLFSAMDSFEMQLLFFMDRYELISHKFAEQIYTAAQKSRDYNPLFVKLLLKYPIADENKRVKVMCLQYMRGGCTGVEAAGWLEKGIACGCRITSLYEAYIRALEYDRKAVLPKEVVHYFAYDTTMDDTHLAYVYAKVIRQQEKIRPEYEERIRLFMLRQLAAGKIDDNLSYLYRNVLMPEDMTEEMQKHLLRISFAHEVTVPEEKYKYCIVRHNGMNRQEKFPFKGKHAVITLYSDDYVLLFEDAQGRSHWLAHAYEVRPLFGFDRMKILLKNSGLISFGECFHECLAKPVWRIDEAHEFLIMEKKYRWLLKREELDVRFGQELAGNLLSAYARFDCRQELDAFLQESGVENFAGKDRAEYVRCLCERGFYEKSFAAACIYGCERIDDRTMARLCQFVIEEIEGACDEKIVNLTYRVFERGKYTETMVLYLTRWFCGTAKKMRDIWKAAVAMDVDAMPVAERILEQLLFAGAYTADRQGIFNYYCENGGRDSLICLYLTSSAIEYLVRDEEVEPEVFERLTAYMQEGKEFEPGAGIALLKYNSERAAQLTQEEQRLYAKLLGKSLGEDIYFPFYGAYTFFYPVLEIYHEKNYVEYRAEKGKEVVIHYFLDGRGGEDASYCQEKMNEIYPGIYQKEFRLFWGERLQYYVTEGKDGQEQFVMSGCMERSELLEEGGHGRFRMLNDLALSIELQDYHTADVLIQEYAKNEFMTAKMLRIK